MPPGEPVAPGVTADGVEVGYANEVACVAFEPGAARLLVDHPVAFGYADAPVVGLEDDHALVTTTLPADDVTRGVKSNFPTVHMPVGNLVLEGHFVDANP